jgi:hypothetical protein
VHVTDPQVGIDRTLGGDRRLDRALRTAHGSTITLIASRSFIAR